MFRDATFAKAVVHMSSRVGVADCLSGLPDASFEPILGRLWLSYSSIALST